MGEGRIHNQKWNLLKHKQEMGTLQDFQFY